MLGVHYKNTHINNNRTSVNYNVNNYSNNGGGSSTLKKKYGNKFTNVSSNRAFSINGNNYNTYIGNQNNIISHDPFSNSSNTLSCKSIDNSIKTSVKNYKGLLQTRIVNDKLKCNSVNSFDCYKKNNAELINQDISLNKHFNSNNKDQSSHTELLKSKCIPINKDEIKTTTTNCGTITDSSLNNINNINNINCNVINNTAGPSSFKNCNITKDVNTYKVPEYNMYLGSLFRKKKCLYNPPDAKVIAC